MEVKGVGRGAVRDLSALALGRLHLDAPELAPTVILECNNKTGSTLSVIRWCSGRGSGSPLMRTFAGSKPLMAAFFAGLTVHLRRRAADGSGKPVDSPIAPSLNPLVRIVSSVAPF